MCVGVCVCVLCAQVELTAKSAPDVVGLGEPFEVEWRVFNKSDRAIYDMK